MKKILTIGVMGLLLMGILLGLIPGQDDVPREWWSAWHSTGAEAMFSESIAYTAATDTSIGFGFIADWIIIDAHVGDAIIAPWIDTTMVAHGNSRFIAEAAAAGDTLTFGGRSGSPIQDTSAITIRNGWDPLRLDVMWSGFTITSAAVGTLTVWAGGHLR